MTWIALVLSDMGDAWQPPHAHQQRAWRWFALVLGAAAAVAVGQLRRR